MTYKTGIKTRCINNRRYKHLLKIGNEYEILENPKVPVQYFNPNTDIHILVNGEYWTFPKSFFEIL